MVRMKKEIMRVGRFQMRNGKEFDVTKERLDHWAETFNTMERMKINVPACKDHICNAENTVGRVEEMGVENDSLYAVFEFPRESDAEMAKINDVSIATRDTLVTGVGNFSDAIEHVAITPKPVVPGMSGYSLVCSLGDMAPSDNSGSVSTGRQESSGKASGYALQRAMEIVAGIFGVSIPPEAGRSEEAAITYLQTIASCKQAGIIQEMKQTPAPAPTQEEPEEQKPEEPAEEQTPEVPQTDAEQQENPNEEAPAEEAPAEETSSSPENQVADEEEEKKKRTPGEDGIVASLNDYRRMVIENSFSKAGMSAEKTEDAVTRFCRCETQEDYFRTVPEFEAFREGITCSLEAFQSLPMKDMLVTTMTGPQVKSDEGEHGRRKSIFEMRGELRK